MTEIISLKIKLNNVGDTFYYHRKTYRRAFLTEEEKAVLRKRRSHGMLFGLMFAIIIFFIPAAREIYKDEGWSKAWIGLDN